MRFGVDAHAIGFHLTGNEVYVRNLLASFASLDRDAEFIAYLATDDVNGWVPAGFRRRTVAGNPFLRLGYDLARHLRRDRPDLVHVQYTAPLACPVPVVVSVHDVSFEEHPEYFRDFRRRQLCLTVKRTVRAAVRVITGSEFSRAAIARAYGVNPDDIAVVPNAAASIFRPVAKNVAAARVERRLRIPGPFVLTVGDLQPRKNQVGLVRAFAEAARSDAGFRHRLVIAGKDTWFSPQVRRVAEQSGVSDRIVFAGFVADEDLASLYNACDAFVFPSYYEGFGLPPLEAMACGRAVACSNVSALPEVVDAAAVLFDPHDQSAMARAILDLTLDVELRARMERLGLARAAQFNWRATAQKTLDVYYSVACREAARVRVPRSLSVSS